MAGYWSETRPNGKPIEPGTVCWVTEGLDGAHPIYTYGKDQQEVIDKLSRTQAHAQAALARRQAPPATPPAATAAQPPQRMSADEVMQATADLQNPGKAGSAVARLVQDATGVDLTAIALNTFAAMATQWEDETPDFYRHPGNKQLLVSRAKAYVSGDIARVTKQHLTQAFNELQAAGLLFEEPESQADPTPPTHSAIPAETQVQRIERPRRFATSVRSTSFRAPQSQATQSRTPKYSADEIRTMPTAKSRALIEADDKDYRESCEFHFGAQATA